MKNFFIYSGIIVIIVVFVIARLVDLLLNIFSNDKELDAQKFLYKWSHRLFWVINSKVEFSGLENIPATGPVIIVARYRFPIDLIISTAIFKRKVYLAVDSTFFVFPLSFMSKSAGYLNIDNKNLLIAAQQMDKTIEKLRAGSAIFMFISRRTDIDSPVHGPAFASLETNIPVIPIAINSTPELSVFTNFIYGMFVRKKVLDVIKVRIGEPIMSNEQNDRIGRVKFTEEIVRKIDSMLKK
ncbi:MAG: lysophospholipid acyltransferase family protein [Candidatus Saganbacteria bacterium]|nr:lysophospholipid acyltransferase family protein [Candidatus Saganbacteria bacterium]